MTTDTYLGADGVASDECLTRYYFRDGKLLAECWGGTSPIDPAKAIAELEHSASLSAGMAEHGGEYPARARICRQTAANIREATANV